jgi:hypothetical protein
MSRWAGLANRLAPAAGQNKVVQSLTIRRWNVLLMRWIQISFVSYNVPLTSQRIIVKV